MNPAVPQPPSLSSLPGELLDRLRRISESLALALDVRLVILFGSAARGTQDPGSDLDLLVIAETGLPPAERIRTARRALARERGALDLLVFTPAEFEQLRSWPSSVVGTALAEGIVVHEAA
ncbi:MAG: nucleotidyltransferase domain-containing protein [Myxococcota bacterium]|jgi:predicted nucleotidyltransferase|nr:nucleotidyltransferase domain-containing protein [Myxococcota bacterium]